MDDFNSETDSEYTSYWKDWVGKFFWLHPFSLSSSLVILLVCILLVTVIVLFLASGVLECKLL